MATTLYFRTTTCGISRGTADANLRGSAVGWLSYGMSTSRGAGATTVTVTTVGSNTSGLELVSEHGEWISDPLSADVTIAGNITFNLRGSESSMSANAAFGCVVQRIDSTGAVQETVYSGKYTSAELNTSEGAQNWTADATDTVFHKGDRIRIRVFAGNYGTMGDGYTVTFYLDGPTGGASGDSYITFTEAIAFLAAPAGSVIYLTDTASDVATAAVDREAWTSRGGGVANDVTNTAAGFTAPIQVTDTAGGTVVDWWTRQLTAFTLGGRVDANIRGKASASSSYAVVRVELAVCNSDGSSPVVWAAANETYPHNSAAEDARTVIVSGDDVSVTAGQRLRIRLYLDDGPAGDPGYQVTAMSAGKTVTTYYAGSAGATGDTYLTLTQSVSEYTAGTSANAGVATATASASGSSESIGQSAGTATSTGAAYNATGQPGAIVTAGLATATASAAASSESVAQTVGVAASTGLARQPSMTVGQTTGVAAATGTAVGPSESIGQTAGSAAATGLAAAPSESVAQSAGVATATGTGLDATGEGASITNVYPTAAEATASASGASAGVGQSAGIATSTGSAAGASFSPSVSATAGVAAATGTAAVGPSVSIGQSAGLATSTGAAATSSEGIAQSAGLATGTGTALDATASTTAATYVYPDVATGTGSALGPSVSISQTAAAASGAAVAYGASVTIGQTAGVATATGAASGAVVNIAQTVGVAQASGAAANAEAQVSSAGTVYPTAASSVGAAYGPSPSIGQTTVTATGTGAAYAASVSIGQFVGIATATAQALDATATTTSTGTGTADVATATGEAYGAVFSVSGAVVAPPSPSIYRRRAPAPRVHPAVLVEAGIARGHGQAWGVRARRTYPFEEWLLGLSDEQLFGIEE